MLLTCQVSKKLDKGNLDFWFGLKRTTRESLQDHENAFCAFGLGSPERVVLLPLSVLAPHLGGMFTSPNKDGAIQHWHIRFVNTDKGVALLVAKDQKQLDVTDFLLKD